jgi:hypothetical protein
MLNKDMGNLSKNEQSKIYRANNKPKGELYRYKKRAKKHNSEHVGHNQNIEKVYHEMRYRLQGCLGIPFVVDHILPLERGGFHHHKNLQTIPLSLQKRKGLSLSYKHQSLIYWMDLSDDMISHIIDLQDVKSELLGNVKCPACSRFLSPSSFYKKYKTSDILHITCKECMDARTKQWKVCNREHIKSKQKDYWDVNKYKYKISSKDYKIENKDKISKQMKIWNRENKHLKLIYQNKRRAIKLSQYHVNHNTDIEKVLTLMSNRISKCCGVIHNVDHILPLSAGGYHHHLNLQVIPASINFSKKDSLLFKHPLLLHWSELPDYLLDKIKL